MADSEQHGDAPLAIPAGKRTQALLLATPLSRFAQSPPVVGISSKGMDDKHRVERVVQAEKIREPAFIIRGSEMSGAIGEAAGQLRRTAYALAPEIRNVYLNVGPLPAPAHHLHY